MKENTDSTKVALRKVKAKVQREIRAMKDKWWNDKAKKLQDMSDKHGLHGLYTRLEAICGPKSNEVGPVLSADGCQLYTNIEDITARWKEHFCNLLNQQGEADPRACHKKEQRETKEELSDPITGDEGVKAIKSTRGGKALGQDGIPAELWRHGGLQPRKELVKLSNAHWSNECIPQDFKDAFIITIYKKKGQGVNVVTKEASHCYQ